MIRILLVLTSLTFMACASSTSEVSTPHAAPPNILFCISDDQSWQHTSIMGAPEVQTPHFDRVAREGILFANAYCAAPSCAASRAAILSGQAMWRLREGGLLFGALPQDIPLLPPLLREAGYAIGSTFKGYGPRQPCVARLLATPAASGLQRYRGARTRGAKPSPLR